ncbi:MAG: hypothetical protein COW00_08030 [Bdellovibrio sp. CG12_big_fil_rev_8_21_14_0_65_39_13]|nr:MAG: hypothetical protein COW78_11815 [Bdellovibrio sp. CG22_combo_CG10-13_8_21_14_all_39_27]PIQ59991.1 MAG: hypothetical protein COW00_08030 [Bdellovibrio sp. CG12_big_fil_rev_8_21_14_0_65_39_13]PIR35250.1 MAG: hypothetical protein COV37_09140 [Bdellovibrio sp. CG11_big_fil_rev_8_21_14_0_20_39_38]
MMKKLTLLLIALFIFSCGQDPLKASKSRMTSQSSSSPLSCRANSGVVCGQPPMPICAEGMMCAQVMPNPLNYDNECLLFQSGARLLYDGACKVQ